MAVTYGFYNALNHDRLYDAIQMSSIFDGIIRDGIFSTIGDTMIVTAPEDGLYVNVGSGRAWFNHTWTLNDTAYPIEAEQAEVVLDRIDAVILEVNSSAEVRANSIKFLKGTPSSNPVKPTLTHNAEVNQYALAYVRIRAGQTTIFQSDIENAVGTDETPFITGVLQQVSIETLLKQWEAEFNTYFTNFQNTSTTEFDDWFQRMKDQLSQDAAGNLQLQIDDIADEKANNDIISDAWNASTTYAVGQYCIYNNSLWKCLVQHSGQTPTEGTYWTKVNVANEITSVNNSFVERFNKNKFFLEIMSYGDRSSYSAHFGILSKGFSSAEQAYRNTMSTPLISGLRASCTIPDGSSGGSFTLTNSGTHTLTIEENTLGLDVPTSFTDKLTISGWKKSGIIICKLD